MLHVEDRPGVLLWEADCVSSSGFHRSSVGTETAHANDAVLLRQAYPGPSLYRW